MSKKPTYEELEKKYHALQIDYDALQSKQAITQFKNRYNTLFTDSPFGIIIFKLNGFAQEVNSRSATVIPSTD